MSVQKPIKKEDEDKPGGVKVQAAQLGGSLPR
jgi:hypothetical protein